MSDEPTPVIDLGFRPPGFSADPGSFEVQFSSGFARRQQAREEAEWQSILGTTATPQGGSSDVETPTKPEKPSIAKAGVTAGLDAFAEGGKLVAEGLDEIINAGARRDVGQSQGGMASFKKMFDGLMSMGLSPFVAAGAAGGQLLENENPGLAATQFATGQEALNYRAFLAMRAQKDLTPDERQAMSQPMTIREALETAVTLAGPALAMKAPGAVRKAGEFNKKLGQRGALGGEQPKDTTRMLFTSESPELKPILDKSEGSPKKAIEDGYITKAPEGHYEITDKGIRYLEEQGPEFRESIDKIRGMAEALKSQPPPAKPPAAGGGGGADVPPPEPPAGGPASPTGSPQPRANMARIGAEADVKALIADLNVKAQQAGIIRTEKIAHAETAAKATAKDLTIDRALKLDFGDLHVNATALRDLRDHAFRQLREMEIAANAGDPQAQTQLPYATVVAALLESQASKAGTDIGRALSSFNIVSEGGRAYSGADIVALADTITAGILPGDSLAARLKQLATKQQRQVFLRQLVERPDRPNIFYEAWINGLLSNPVTHAANTAGNAMTAAWGIAERQMAGMFNVVVSPAFPNPEGVRVGEATVMLRACVQACKEAAILATKALRDDKDVFGGQKMEIAPALTPERFGLTPENAMYGFVDGLGAGIRLPSRLLMTEDAFWKWFNYRIALEAKGYREGRILGLSGDALADFTRDYVAKGKGDLEPESVQYALMQTFNNELTKDTIAGKLGLAGKAAQNVPLARLILPFVKVPVNVGEYTWERSPVLSLISQRLVNDLRAGGSARDLALARVGTGAMLTAVYMQYSAAGLMTGGAAPKGPAGDALTQLGRQDYSLRVGDDLYRINRLDPVGKTLGLMATYAEIAGQLPENRRIEGAVALVLAVSETMKDQPYFMGLSTAIEAVNSPTSSTKTVIEKFVPSLVPYSGLLHQVKKSGIPGVLEGDPIKRNPMALDEVEELFNVWKKDLPGLSTSLPADRNYITGEPIAYPPGWGPDIVSPVQVTALNNDPVFVEIARNQPSLPKPPKAIAGTVPSGLQMSQARADAEGILLTPQEYDRLVELQTKVVQDGQGRNLHQSLTDLVTREEYQQYPAGKGSGRARMIERRYDLFHREAIARLRQEDQRLDDAIKDTLEHRMQKRLGTGQPAPAPFQIGPGMTLPARR
jgi:hypothetical protein